MKLLTRQDKGVGEGPFDSVNWALTTHVKIVDDGFYNSAVLYGSEDAPSRIDFYTQFDPQVTDTVAWSWQPREPQW
jgi:hypothetical protein